jgi:hypothetical protein
MLKGYAYQTRESGIDLILQQSAFRWVLGDPTLEIILFLAQWLLGWKTIFEKVLRHNS